MEERILAFLKAEQLSSARFADIMNIQRAGVSHLLSGRNKPGFGFFEKFMQKFPTINIEWLISGRGKMYKEQANSPAEPQFVVKTQKSTEAPNLFSVYEEQAPPAPPTPVAEPSRNETAACLPPSERHIKKVIILYSDGTFDERG